MRRAAWVMVAVLALPLGGCSEDEPSTGPVIAMAPSDDDDDRAYPLAEVAGFLRLEDGCLTIDGTPVFWPAGTGWDEEWQAVTFGGDFEGAGSWAVGHAVRGGGGYYAMTDLQDAVGFVGEADVARLETCTRQAGDDDVVMAWPPWPESESADPLGE